MLRRILRYMAVGSLCLGLFGPAVAEDEMVLPPSAEKVRPILVGMEAPVGILKTGAGVDVDLAAVLAEQPSVLVFYRGMW
ncbi:MAG: hypothetical protein O2954_19995 [bacterium]|nr:hypothetical protein [bacterium]